MFDQSMGDCYNHNYYCEPSAFGRWWNDNGYCVPWYGQYPYDNCHWHYGFNNYGDRYPASDHYHMTHFANMPALNGPSMEYKHHLREHNYIPENGRTTNSAWNSVKIDCFATQMQSESSKSNSGYSLKKTTFRRKTRKSKLGATSEGKTTLQNLLGKLCMEICSSGGTLAYILLQSETSRNNDKNCGDGPNALPFEIKNQFLDELNRQLNAAESLDTSVSAHTNSIKNLKKLCTGKGECLRSGVKPTSVHSSTEKLGGKSTRSCKISEAKAKTAKSNKNIPKSKRTLCIEEPMIEEISLNKEKQQSREHQTRKASKLSKSQQRGYVEKSWLEKFPIKNRKQSNEKEPSKVIATIAALQKRVKVEMLTNKVKLREVFDTRKPSGHKSFTLATGEPRGRGEYHITWRV